MAIDLPDLAAGVAGVSVEHAGHAFTVTLRLGGYDYQAHRDLWSGIVRPVALPDTLPRHLSGWTVRRRGRPVPLTPRSLRRVSLPLLAAVGRALSRELTGDVVREDLARWIYHRGNDGAAPDWYAFLKSAETARVPAWIMANLPDTAGHYLWHKWALDARWAENYAEDRRSRQRRIASR